MSLKKVLSVVLALFLLLTVAFFALRESLLDHAMTSVLTKAEARAGYQIELGASGFNGILTIELNDLIATNVAGDTVILCDQIVVTPSVWRWVLGRLPVKLICMNHLHVHLDLLKLTESGKRNEAEEESPSGNRISKINNLIDKVASLEGLNIILNDAVFQQNYEDGTSEKLLLSKFSFDHHEVDVQAATVYNDQVSEIRITGNFEPSTLNTNVTGKWKNPSENGLPFIRKISGAVLQADSFSINIGQNYENGDEREYIVSFSAISGRMSHPRVGPEPVSVDSLALALTLRTGPTEVKAIAPSIVTINKLPLHFTFLAHQSDTTRYGFSLDFDSVPSMAFFESLPEGLFESLKGISTTGHLSYRMAFGINPEKPDSLLFYSQLKGHAFKIKSYGKENFSMMSGTFNHEVRENDRLIRTVTVGPENPVFTPLANVSPLLVNAIMICEDANFFYHKGFSEKAFRQSIVTNIRQKRFARGGSTISMQLVKNVYLSRNKTISRKIEEALIVWLIENNRLVTKERMMEVYLNIIEWGPGIYGVGEATGFYFEKQPSELNLNEAIYMASIIPRPKYFKYTFDTTGTLKEYLKPHFNLVTERMVKKEIITPEQAATMNYNIQLSGKARDIVIPVDSSQTDSLEVEIQNLIVE